MTTAIQHATDTISQAKTADERGDAAGRNNLLSQLRGDSDLAKRTLETLIRKAGLK